MSMRTVLIVAATALIAVTCSRGGFAQISSGTYQGVGTVGCLTGPGGFTSYLVPKNPSESQTASYNAYFYVTVEAGGIGTAAINSVGLLDQPSPSGQAWYIAGNFTSAGDVITMTNVPGIIEMGPSVGTSFIIDKITLYAFPVTGDGLDIVALNPTIENVNYLNGQIVPQICYFQSHLSHL